MNKRNLESTIHTELDRDNDYTAYLGWDALLDAQHPLSDPRIMTRCFSSFSIRSPSYG